jgi:hypothetical protein
MDSINPKSATEFWGAGLTVDPWTVSRRMEGADAFARCLALPAGLASLHLFKTSAKASSRPGRWHKFLYVDFAFPLPHGVGVTPCLHAQQGIHADTKSLFDPQSDFRRMANRS